MYYSFRVRRKLYRKTSDRVATQSLSSVVNRISQRSAGQFFLNRLIDVLCPLQQQVTSDRTGHRPMQCVRAYKPGPRRLDASRRTCHDMILIVHTVRTRRYTHVHTPISPPRGPGPRFSSAARARVGRGACLPRELTTIELYA